MKTRFRRLLSRCISLMCLGAQAYAYTYLSSDAVWQPGAVSMKIKLGSSPVLVDGTNYSTSIQAALQAWNAQLGTVQFSSQITAVSPSSIDNGYNEIVFSDTIGGEAFGSGVLAVTISESDGSTHMMIEADIIFNTAYHWDSYRGDLQTPIDIRRVALHELGHVLGLGHPDEVGQVVSALMNSAISSLDTLTDDDIAGAQSLYGRPNGPPVFTVRPLTRTIIAGQAVTFTAKTASPSLAAVSYQWRHNGQVIAGLSGDTLSLASAVFADGGNYRVDATDSKGSASSYFHLNVSPDQAALVAWGSNDAGQTNVTAGLGKVLATSGGTRHVLALKADGTVAAWGQSFYGQIAVPSGLDHVVAVAAGGTHSMALKNDGSVVAWGDSPYGSTGAAAIVPGGLNNVIAIAAGWGSGMALRSDSTVATWGSSYDVPKPAGLTGVVQIASGAFHFLALRENGTVVGWGENFNGAATPPSGLSGVVAIAAGGSASGGHSLALKSDGTVIAWGYNAFGQCNIPAGLGNVTAIAAGGHYSLALRSDGTLVGWGQNDDGQLSVPADLGEMFDPDAGFAHSLVLVRAKIPQFTVQPATQTVNVGSDVDFFVTVTGTAPFSYQWKRNGAVLTDGANISGSATANLQLTSVQLAEAGTFTVEVSNAGGTAVSTNAVLSVATPPILTQVPLSRVAIEGAPTTFAVTATGGGPFTYRWRHNRQLIVGATGPSLSLPNPTVSDAGYYSADVINAAGGVATTVFYLSVAIADPTITVWGDWAHATPTIDGAISAIDTGAANVALKSDGTVVAWGINSVGQLTVPPGLSGVAALSAGDRHTLALKSDGTVVGWGDNTYGQATAPAGLNKVVSVAAGYDYSMALRSNGTVVAWGNTYSSTTAVPAGLSKVVAIAASYNLSVALKSDGTLVVWGDGIYHSESPPAGLNDVVSISAGFYHFVALRANGTVVAWGQDYAGSTIVPTGLSNVVAVAAGSLHSLALKSDGTVVAWGRNYEGQATVPPGLGGVVAVAAGDSSMALCRTSAPMVTIQASAQTVDIGGYVILSASAGGSLPLGFQWRCNGTNLTDGNGIVGANTSTLAVDGVQAVHAGTYDVIVTNAAGSKISNAIELNVNAPPVFTLRPLSRLLTAGQNVTFTAMTSNPLPGSVTYQWKHNGELIGGATSSTLALTDVSFADRGFYEVIAVNAAAVSTSVLNLVVASVPTGNEMVLPWGEDQYGAYGPTEIPYRLTGVVAVAAGQYHAVALKGDGTIQAWGVNNFGPTTVPNGLKDVVGIAAGYYHTLALLANGTVLSWGNYSGSPPPVPAGLRNVVAVAARGTSNVALKSDGTVVTWGLDAPPAGLANVVAVAAGAGHALALKADGTVVAWGGNSNGESTVPAGLTGVIAVGAGDDHSLAVTSNGSVVAWGRNDVGQCNVPTGLQNVVSVAAGFVHSIALKADGSVLGWGRDNEGESSTPTGFGNVATISSGSYYNLVLAPSPAPTITVQPVTQTTAVGKSVTFGVAAAGAAGFQWMKNGYVIPGATNAALTINDVQLYDAGTYAVVASNSAGNAFSDRVALIVVDAVYPQLFALHSKVLLRDPTTAEMLANNAAIANGATLPRVYEQLLMTAEYQNRRIESVIRLYYAALARPPDYGGLMGWSGVLRIGQSTLPQVAQAFVGSAEFLGRYGSLDDRQFVQQLYRNVLHREADPGGLTFWLGQISGGASRGAVLSGFSESPEFQQLMAMDVAIERAFALLLGRMPAWSESVGWTEFLQGQDQTGTFLDSAEFAALHPGGLSNTTFVELGYQGLLRRPVDAAGQAFWAGQLSGTQITRPGLIYRLIGSGEYSQIVAPVFRFYGGCLGRQPDASGLAGWTGYIRAGHTLGEVAQGFVASSEFQTRTAALTNAAFVQQLYRDVLGREADPSGLTGWATSLDAGQLTRTDILYGFVQSAEAQERFAPDIRTYLHYLAFLQRYPSAGELRVWSTYLTGVEDQFIQELLDSAEYSGN
jgi:alpha-tubulin suppressor-like RCC1 family protein